jgi:hypothetical protein
MYLANVRLLACEFEIRTNSWEVIALLKFLMQRAEQDMPVVERGLVTVTSTCDEFRYEGDGIEPDFELTAPSAVDALYNRLYDRAIAALPDHIRIIAAYGARAGNGFLMAGPAGSGKTVLAIHLLLDGFEITGDMLVLLRDTHAIPFPRKFYLREEGVPLLPRLASRSKFAAAARNPQTGRVIALDPLEFGKPWRIAATPVESIFWLEPNFGAARSVLRRCSKVDMVRNLVSQCVPPASRRRDWLSDLCTTVDGADTHVLALGNLDSATTAMRGALRHL